MEKKGRGLQLTDHAALVLERRYLLKNERGEVIETPLQLFERVARAVSEVELWDKAGWFDKFLEIMMERRFLPNSPTLMNAGKKSGQLAACFVLPIGDSLDSIFDSLKFAAKIHQSGGGTGFSFSRLRAQGSLVRSSQGVASGPVSFMKVFDVATETVKQGGTRRGANMAVLQVDHPDILEFIQCKNDLSSMTNFNISVAATDEFMRAVRGRGAFWIKDPRTGHSTTKMDAKEVFDQIVSSAWKCGDPGLVFIDRMNLFNPTSREGAFESTNPCGEQPLLPFESCNLGSLNLGSYFRARQFDWKAFRQDIWTAVRFLDNVIDINFYPILDSKRITLRNRKIGLGVMGFADLLILEGLPYTSIKAIRRGEQLMSFLDREAKRASEELARKRGPFPNWKGSLWESLGYSPLRNATVSTVAPTGTISIIAGASSGIEPLFSGVFIRNVLGGEKLLEVHPTVQRLLKGKGLKLDSLTNEVLERELGPVWTPSQSVPVGVHVKMQAAFQHHSDSGVSKTINLPEKATLEDVAAAYLLAYDFGCKGITVYRDQCRPSQVLEHGLPDTGGVIDDEECFRCTPT